MSHIVEIKTQVRDAAAVRDACQRLKLDKPQQGTFRLFGSQATGLAVRLRTGNTRSSASWIPARSSTTTTTADGANNPDWMNSCRRTGFM